MDESDAVGVVAYIAPDTKEFLKDRARENKRSLTKEVSFVLEAYVSQQRIEDEMYGRAQ